MPLYTVFQSVGYDVEADSAEEAWDLFMANPDAYEVTWRETEHEVYDSENDKFVQL
jgi:hypothetical protein